MAMVVIEMEPGVFVRVSDEEAARLGKSAVAKTAAAHEPKNKAIKPESKKTVKAEPVVAAADTAGDEVSE